MRDTLGGAAGDDSGRDVFERARRGFYVYDPAVARSAKPGVRENVLHFVPVDSAPRT